jgi:hypothetical protein
VPAAPPAAPGDQRAFTPRSSRPCTQGVMLAAILIAAWPVGSVLLGIALGAIARRIRRPHGGLGAQLYSLAA